MAQTGKIFLSLCGFWTLCVYGITVIATYWFDIATNAIMFFALVFAGGIFSGAFTGTITSMLPDTVEYTYLKTGIRSDGVINAIGSFLRTSGSALGGAVLGFILDNTGFVLNVEQAAETVNGISMMWTLGCGVVTLIACFIFLFYKIDSKKHHEMVEKIKHLQLSEK